MNMQISVALKDVKKYSRIIEHNGERIPPERLQKILEDAEKEGYQTIFDIPDSFIEERI